MENRAHWTKILFATHSGTGFIFLFFTENILWIIPWFWKYFLYILQDTCGGPDTDLKLDIMKLNSYIIQLTVYLCIFDTSKIYDIKSSQIDQQYDWILEYFVKELISLKKCCFQWMKCKDITHGLCSLKVESMNVFDSFYESIVILKQGRANSSWAF